LQDLLLTQLTHINPPQITMFLKTRNKHHGLHFKNLHSLHSDLTIPRATIPQPPYFQPLHHDLLFAVQQNCRAQIASIQHNFIPLVQIRVGFREPVHDKSAAFAAYSVAQKRNNGLGVHKKSLGHLGFYCGAICTSAHSLLFQKLPDVQMHEIVFFGQRVTEGSLNNK
jgi:hypothetical protein